jgi:hypothetical protein
MCWKYFSLARRDVIHKKKKNMLFIARRNFVRQENQREVTSDSCHIGNVCKLTVKFNDITSANTSLILLG